MRVLATNVQTDVAVLTMRPPTLSKVMNLDRFDVTSPDAQVGFRAVSFV